MINIPVTTEETTVVVQVTSGVSGTTLPDQSGNSGKFLSTDGSDPLWLTIAGGGDMLASVYDPTGILADAFSMANMVEATDAKILTALERTTLGNISGMNTGDDPGVTSVTGTSPVVSSGGNTPAISLPPATNAAAGHATAVHITAIEANTAKITNATHTGEVTGSGALTIASNAVVNTKLSDMATATVKGRVTAGTGDPEDLTAPQVRTLLSVESGADVTSTHETSHADVLVTGDVGTTVAAALGVDDNYVTDAEKVVIGNTAGTNLGDQDEADILPLQTGNTGKVLSTNGTVSSWVAPDAASLPDQTGNNGKFLSTDGVDPSWQIIAGGGDMLALTYDPTSVAGDAFSMANMSETAGAKILTALERTTIAATSGTNTGDQDLSAHLTDADIGTTVAPVLTSDENYVTDDEKVIIGNTSGTNTGDQQLYRGTIATPAYTDNVDGTITLGAIDVVLYTNPGFTGIPKLYTIPGGTFTFTDESLTYLAAFYNAGVPDFRIVSDVQLFSGGDYAPIFSVFRTGIYLHVTPWDSLGSGLPEKTFFAAARTLRYLRENGLSLSEYGTRNLSVTAGTVYVALSVPMTLGAATSVGDMLFYYKHVAGVWTRSTETQYGNTYYDDGSNLVEALPNQYIVQWVWRGVEDTNHIYMITGSESYNLTDASASDHPVPPSAISSHAILVGRIIVRKGEDVATSIQSSFVDTFGSATVRSHADLIDLDYSSAGHTGFAPALVVGENYVTDAEKVVIGNTSGTNTGDQDLSTYLTDADIGTTVAPALGVDDNYVTDAERVVIIATSGTNTGDNPGVTSVSGTSPVVSSGGDTPAISLPPATNAAAGHATAAHITAIEANTSKSGVTDQISNVVEDVTPQLGGPLALNSKPITEILIAGESVVEGDLCYLKSDGKMWKTNAGAEATTVGLLGTATGSLAADASGAFILYGRATGLSGLAVGGVCYMGITAGGVTTTKPAETAGNFIRVVGFAIAADTMIMQPSPVWVEI